MSDFEHTEPIQDLYDRYIEEVVEPMRLDGQEYQPSPQIVPDTREGWDLAGDYHAVEHFTVEGLNRVITPHRWASYLQDAVTQYCSTMDYTVGRAERCDIVQDIVSERMEAVDTMEERYALEDALQIWFRIYGSNGL